MHIEDKRKRRSITAKSQPLAQDGNWTQRGFRTNLNAVESVARHLATDYVDPEGLEALLANPGIALNKKPGLLPMGAARWSDGAWQSGDISHRRTSAESRGRSSTMCQPQREWSQPFTPCVVSWTTPTMHSTEAIAQLNCSTSRRSVPR